MTFLFGRRRTAENRKIIERLNEDIVAAVRQPAFYEAGGVPDTFEGRFELLVLHGSLVLRRLRSTGEPGPEVAQKLVDMMFRNLDPALRELGVGDLAVPKRMKRLAEAFLGRSVAYDAALNEGDEVRLAEALSRNVYAGARPAGALARYAVTAAAALAARNLDELLGTRLRFPDAAAFLAEEKP